MNIKDFYTKQDIELGKDINVYVCGPTVYNHAHIGNIRPVLVFDVLNRLYKLTGNKINYVHNITDIDDKIIDKAIELGKTEKEVADEFEKAYLNLMDSLNILRPDHMPKVTEYIDGMITFIGLLIEKGYAYESNGSVYFSVKKLENYGKFGNLTLDSLIDEEISEDKEDSKDFAVWKSTTKGVTYESPWGNGRPGWHTECSFFIKEFFKDEGIHLHGGGIDLKFPHHINEMAQYEAVTGKKTENAWLYVGHINMENEKMSKSLGNTILAKDFIEKYDANTLRYLILSTQYLKPINITDDAIDNAVNTINKIKSNLQKVFLEMLESDNNNVINFKISNKVVDILNDNLNVVEVITMTFELIKEMNLSQNKEEKIDFLHQILGNLSILGLNFNIRYDELKDELLNAKREKNYTVFDKLREELIN